MELNLIFSSVEGVLLIIVYIKLFLDMKLKTLTVLFFFISTTILAQRKEIRKAESALDHQEYYIAKKLLEQADSGMALEKKRIKARYFNGKGWAYLGLNSGAYATKTGYDIVEESFKKAIEYGEKQAGNRGLNSLEQVLVDNAINDREKGKYTQAYKQFYRAYQVNPKDTVYLFSAANTAFETDDHETAIKLYKQLKALGYKGNQKQYMATDKVSGQKQIFANERQREVFVKTAQFENPKNFRQSPKNGVIIRQLGYLYLRKDDPQKAVALIEEAKKSNPDDFQILQAAAMVYKEMGDLKKYKHLFQALIRKDPEHAGDYYVLLGEHAFAAYKDSQADDYFHKALAINPELVKAYRGLANIIIQKQVAITEEMKALRSQEKTDTKSYRELDKNRKSLLQGALPYLEKVQQYGQNDFDTIRALYQINLLLGHSEKADEYRIKMKELAQGQE